MSKVTRAPKTAAVRLGGAALLLLCWCAACMGTESANKVVTVMTRNMDAGTDLGFLFGATDQLSYVQGMGATVQEIAASDFQGRAAALAKEIQTTLPDLVALEEVTLWRTGPLGGPATTVLYDQLDLLQASLVQAGLHYGVVAVQIEQDAEAPVPYPDPGFDLRMTDRDVILVRLDAPQAQFDVLNAETHRFKSVFAFGNPLLGQLAIPCGWLAVDANVNGSKFKFVMTHLQSPIAGVPEAQQVQQKQVDELLAALAPAGPNVVLVGDFNANAEYGPEHTGAVEKIVKAGFTDTWALLHPGDPGYTWPLFGEDQNSGLAQPVERIDLVFAGGPFASWLNRAAPVLTAERTGVSAPFASDHAGVIVKLQLK